MWKNDSWYFHLCQSPHEETFSTWKIILSSKCFSSTFERSLFHDPLDTLALKGLRTATQEQPARNRNFKRARTPLRTSKSARTVIPTNFYADELIRGEPQIENWKMNYDARVWVRPRTTTRVELIRGYTGPTDQRRSAGTTVSGSDDFLHLTQSYSATVECSRIRSSQLQRWDAVQKKTPVSVRLQKALPILKDRTCLEKDTNECSCLICDSSCCRTSCVSVQTCTPKVLPNTEMFLPSRVFCLTCVVSALCSTCTMYVSNSYRPVRCETSGYCV